MDQNRRQFLAETEDLIEQLFEDLDKLRDPSLEIQVRRELIDAIFRLVHRVKGSAASFGLDGLSEIAHEFESLLSAIRAGQTSVDDDVLNTCDDAVSALAESLHLASSGIVEPSRRELFDRMRALAQGIRVRPEPDVDTILGKVPFEIWQALTDDEKQRLVHAVSEGTRLCVITTSFEVANFDDQFSSLKKRLEDRGEVVATSPSVDQERSDKINFRILFASKSNLQDLNSYLVNFPGVSITDVGEGRNELAKDEARASSQPAALRPRPASSMSNFIRTDLNELDRLISSIYELFRTTSKALDLARAPAPLDEQDRGELEKLDNQIRRSFLEVERELISFRMVSLGPILQRAARAGRAAARLSNKYVDFQIVGGDLRVDRLLGDAIADPLIQLVRNAVDHGIETATELVAPKKKRDVVRIEAASQGKQTCLRVVDTGRGVDPDLVSRAAIRLGIIDTDVTLDMERSLRLIFRPGFTTVSSASFVSGRGVGLDLVENAVEQVGGELRVSSEVGKGSTFEIRLPVTFGVIHSTVVWSGSSRYCIDAKQIVKTEIFQAKQIETMGKHEVLRSETEVLPLVRLRELLGQPSNKSVETASVPIVACEYTRHGVRDPTGDNKRIGIIVDRVEGSEEILVRNLGRHAARWTGIAGATELRDGTVALVLDVPRLIQGRRRQTP